MRTSNMRKLILMHKLSDAFDVYCKPVMKKHDMPQTSLDILMFIGDNPELNTASDIVNLYGIKANLVSMHINRLEEEGFIFRERDENDRRKYRLGITDKSRPIVEDCRATIKRFVNDLWEGIDREKIEAVLNILDEVGENADKILERNS